MRLMTFLILLITTSCASMPKPQPIPRCGLIARGAAPYLYCKMFDGTKETGEAWRVPISELPQREEKYICTDDAGYSYFEGVFVPKLTRWMNEHCH